MQETERKGERQERERTERREGRERVEGSKRREIIEGTERTEGRVSPDPDQLEELPLPNVLKPHIPS